MRHGGGELPPEDLLLWFVVGGFLWEFLRRATRMDAIDWVAVALWALSPAIVVTVERYLLAREHKARRARGE